MKVREFVEKKICEKAEKFSYLEAADESNLLLAGFFRQLAYTVSHVYERSKKDCIGNSELAEIREIAENSYEEMLVSYKKEWFGGSAVTMEKNKLLMKKLFSRFMDEFYLDFLNGTQPLAAVQKCSVVVADAGEDVLLEEQIHLILKKDGCFMAVVMNAGKNNKSQNGRSDATRLETDLRYAVIKASLESKYEGIGIVPVFFRVGETAGKIDGWVSGKTSKSNSFFLPFTDFYEEGELDTKQLLSRALQVVYGKCMDRQSVKCANCSKSKDCLIQTFSQRKQAVTREAKWKVPTYDEYQRKFIDSDADEILVCAGPGSGKTASLVGKVLRMAADGKPTEKMMIVTYTEKAAAELKARLCDKFDEDEMPYISTLHSVAAMIDRLYARTAKRKPHSIMSEGMEKRMCKEILDNIPEMSGVGYGNYIQGKYCTVNTVFSGLKAYRKDPAAFFRKHHDYVEDEWEKLERLIETYKKEKGYLSYDDVITNASWIMEHSAVVANYMNNRYEYIMVDEYQDINAEQEQLITLLQGKYGALICIGDDDQAIYAFKGCSSKFMQGFKKRHPKAEVIFCKKNYRSTKHIVEFNNYILSRMDKNARIPKVTEYAEYAQEGEMPTLVEKNDIETISNIIDRAISDGYTYDDIAILATMNKDLIYLNDVLMAPTELASAYLINDFLYQVILNTLAIVLKADGTLNPYYRLGYAMEKDNTWFENVSKRRMPKDNVYEMMSFAQNLTDETPEHYVTRFSAFIGMDETDSETQILGIAQQAETLFDLYQSMYDLRFYDDNKKVEYPIKDKITLITSHSCKGMEWKVVIVYDTEDFDAVVSTDGKNSMDARLFYVAASRAKERLYFLKKEGSETIIDDTKCVQHVAEVLPVQKKQINNNSKIG